MAQSVSKVYFVVNLPYLHAYSTIMLCSVLVTLI